MALSLGNLMKWLQTSKGKSELLLGDIVVSWTGCGLLALSAWGGAWSLCSHHKTWAAFQRAIACNSQLGEKILVSGF